MCIRDRLLNWFYYKDFLAFRFAVFESKIMLDLPIYFTVIFYTVFLIVIVTGTSTDKVSRRNERVFPC